MRTKAGRWAAGLALVIVIPLLAMTVKTLQFGAGDRMCRGVTISRIPVGGLTKSDATAAVRTWARQKAGQDLTLTALSGRWSGKISVFGIRPDWKGAVDRAFAVGREGNIISRAICVLSDGGIGKNIDVKLLLDWKQLDKVLSKVARQVNTPHKDARIRIIDSQLQILQDSCGMKLDQKKAAAVIANAIATGATIVPLPVITDPPDVTARDVSSINTLLATFTTPFNPGKRARTHNLSLASRDINGTVLKPGQVFSYNDAVGPRLAGRGYQTAQIFIRGKLEDGLGGGVCQVSSTLYNAVLMAGLKIRERSPHSQVVPYVSPGRDATVAYGQRDFRFQNSNSSPVALITRMTGNRLTIQVYGSAQDKKDIKLFARNITHVPAGSKTIVDRTLAPGVRKVVEKGARGVSAILYRIVTLPDGRRVTEVVSRSKYPPQKSVIAVGGNPLPAKTREARTHGVGI